LPPVVADLSMMERVLTNLLDNAIRHTPDGGNISLTARQQGRRWWLRWPIAVPALPASCGRHCLSGLRCWNPAEPGITRRVGADDCAADAAAARR
jgi:hypothetical protein